ncbi:helix-turn-helix transcriptional regulator [Paenibacillus aquistagni]|uniref:Predicted DNA-binding transcriptional regulator YafY, contains an HTH and WYL domains n=1 Tax=Paenibacillus aquistagni TaxID=1852522 RepID=A0A1X7IAA7_9BACL|nr:YafY family protein [Paenibacillus aquistagni]SMG11614.1 Predicted DNA-binding transcriptional regulator YafY, contains an HTH and WYL domains [Paenibacillus aquistagni]
MMQVHRMFEIIYLLMHKKTLTAKELADQFEVSPRTIYRDIDTLCEAGIPIYTTKGKGGGIRLVDSYILNKSILSEKEQEEILSSLYGLHAVSGDTEQVLSKLSGLFNKTSPSWIEVDLSQWGADDSGKYQLLRTAILQQRVIVFDYYNSYGQFSRRRVEPLQLWFKHKTWYLRAYCTDKEAVRLFKLTRMKRLEQLEDIFEECPLLRTDGLLPDPPSRQTPSIQLVLRIDASQAYRVFDEFEEEQITKEQDGSWLVTVEYPEDEWVYGYLMSYGPYAEVLAPAYIRDILKERLQLAANRYL